MILGLMLVSDSDSQCPPPAPALLVVPVVPPADLLLLRPPSDRPDFFLKITTTTGISLITGQSTTYTVIMATVIMTITINVENQSPFVGLVAFIKLFIKSVSDGKTDGGGIVTPSIFVVAK
ncbi:hypothetical protein GQX74_014689 [Glossina fuscipes]|uniref:Uncharacterized protein n=1 Tax=Glossina palpalis gambiensis TaxID=67801 RepID=A0A1B0BV87_9MUSC|nr:hypothetical protein GQX74_014689 [Glossina fuscipes]